MRNLNDDAHEIWHFMKQMTCVTSPPDAHDFLQAIHAQLKGAQQSRSNESKELDQLKADALPTSAALSAAASSLWCQVGNA